MKKLPAYHYRPQKNWINDPNGLFQQDGWYHIFFQHNQNAPQWGDIHWGHARSRDMMRWETLPIAMAPALEKGEIHCYSGSCCVGYDGVPRVYYTSVGRTEDHRDSRDGAEQWMAFLDEDRLTLTQTDAYALLDPAIHGGMHIRAWRDPHVIRWQDGYLMALGGMQDGRGCITAYTSADGLHWTYRGPILQSDKQDDVSWECPNIFALGDKFGVLYSPFAEVQYAIGTLNDDFSLSVEHTGVIDPAGRQGFYAPQTFVDEQGRQILLGWMPECDGKAAAMAKGWSGAMALPRLMQLSETGDLCCTILPEALAIAGDMAWNALAPGQATLSEHAACSFARIRGRITQPVTLTMATKADGSEYSMLTLSPNGTLTLDRSHSSASPDANRSSIACSVPIKDGKIDLFAAFDHSIIECCVNGQWLSGRVYPENDDHAVLQVKTADFLEAACCDQLQQVNQLF